MSVLRIRRNTRFLVYEIRQRDFIVYAVEVLTAFRVSAKARSEKSVANLAERQLQKIADTPIVDGDYKKNKNTKKRTVAAKKKTKKTKKPRK